MGCKMSTDASAAFKLWKRGQKLGEGTFGEVYIATHEITGEKAALKKIKLECEDEGVPGTTLREVSLLNDAGLDLIAQMLKYTPNERIVAKDALEHPYFANLDKATVGTIPLPI